MQTISTKAWLFFILLTALAIRLWNVSTHIYVVWPDETFQYLEPAHRLAFGSGIVTWEYLYGIRSWLLPGLIAGIMRLVALIDSEPGAYVTVLRLFCVAASLAVPFVGFRMGLRRFGLPGAIFIGLLCALNYQLVYFSPVIMTEPLVADLTLLAIWIGEYAEGDRSPTRRLLIAGLLFGLASTLRYQYAPALGLALLVQHWRDRRGLFLVATSAIAVVLVVLGGLDMLTWGQPFQSVWLNFSYNAEYGFSSAMGVKSWSMYLYYYAFSWGALAPLVLAAVVYGGVRAPALAAVVICTIGLHSLVPHKELRLVFLATACLPILAGIGFADLLSRLQSLRQPRAGIAFAVALAVVVSGATAAATYRNASYRDDWHRDRSMLEATADARAYPAACGLAFRSISVYRSGGYSYWHRDLPIYFDSWDDAQTIPGADLRLPLKNVLAGKDLPQYARSALPANTGKFNVIIGFPDDALPGFAKQSCYGSELPGEEPVCVFIRPGGCD